VILAILKRERDRQRFPLFVSRRYCVPARTFLAVKRYKSLPFFTVFINVCERSMSSLDRLCPIKDQKSSETALKRCETVKNVTLDDRTMEDVYQLFVKSEFDLIKDEPATGGGVGEGFQAIYLKAGNISKNVKYGKHKDKKV
jgi:hypothetical protein